MAKKITTVIVFSILSSTAVFAEDVADTTTEQSQNSIRARTVHFGMNFGKEKYSAGFVGLDWGLDSVWQLTTSFSREKNEQITAATGFSLGINGDFNETFSSYLEFSRSREPDSVVSNGIDLGSDVHMRETTFGLGLRFARYNQDGSRTRVRDGGVAENSATFRLSQKVNESWNARTSYTRYGWGGSNPQELSRAISNRPNYSYDLQAVVEGFPKQAFTLGSKFRFTTDAAMDLTLGRTDYASGQRVNSISVSPEFDLNEMVTLAFLFSGTKSDTGTKSGMLGFTMSIALE